MDCFLYTDESTTATFDSLMNSSDDFDISSFSGIDESSSSLISSHFSSSGVSCEESQSSIQSDADSFVSNDKLRLSRSTSPNFLSEPLNNNRCEPRSLLMRYVVLIDDANEFKTLIQSDPRNASLGHLQVAQPVQKESSRRFYDNINILEGLGFLRRGATMDYNRERYRFVTWYGNRYIESDFRRLYDEGESCGLVRAVKMYKHGLDPDVDTFTSAVEINHDGDGETYSINSRGRSRGKCPIKVAVQRILIILMTAKGTLSVKAILHLLLLPYRGINLKRRYFCIRDILVTFGIAEVSKIRRRDNCLKYCGPSPRPILRHLLNMQETNENITGGEETTTTVVPIYLLNKDNLVPLLTSDPQLESENRIDHALQIQDSENQQKNHLTPRDSHESPIELVPASLLDEFDTPALSATFFNDRTDFCDDEDDFLLHSNSNGSSKLNRSETLLPWASLN